MRLLVRLAGREAADEDRGIMGDYVYCKRKRVSVKARKDLLTLLGADLPWTGAG